MSYLYNPTADRVPGVYIGGDLERPITWIGGDGTTVALSEQTTAGIKPLAGFTGFDMAPHEVQVQPLPDSAGGFTQSVRILPRELFLPVMVYGPDRDTMLARKRELLRTLNPLVGVGQLFVGEPDGSSRWLNCYYVGGAEGDEGQDMSGITWQKLGLKWVTGSDPYWHTTAEELDFVIGAAAAFLPVTLPFTLTSGPMNVVTNNGDVETWPTWVLTGPCSSGSTWENETTGETFALNLALAAAETVTITTDPSAVDIVDGYGNDAWGALGDESVLWALQPGDNTIQTSVPGSSAATVMTVTFTPRYQGA